MQRRNDPLETILGPDHWVLAAINLPFFDDPGPDRIDQIEHRLSCLCTFLDKAPWRQEDVDEGDGYQSGEVFGGENSEYSICSTEMPHTATFIANAPDDVRWLIDRVRELEAAVAER